MRPGAIATVQLKLVGQGMSVPDLEGVLPAVGVTLPSGASLKTGTMDTTLAISGPVDKLVITGPVNLANAQLAGFNLRSKLGALGPLSGPWRQQWLGYGDSNPQRKSARGPQRRECGQFKSGCAHDWHHHGNRERQLRWPAQLQNGRESQRWGRGRRRGRRDGNCSLVFHRRRKGAKGGGIPFKITGTTSNPVFLPDLSGAAGSMVKGITSNPSGAAGAAPTGIIGGLFGKKKTQ